MDADFASVWSRVTGTPPAEDELNKLQRWIRDETEAMRAYEALLRFRLPAPAAETLRSLLREQHRQIQQLQTLYFLRTGDTFVVSLSATKGKRPLMKTLRERYECTQAQAESYRQASSERKDITEACAKLAGEKDAQARALRQLTQRLL